MSFNILAVDTSSEACSVALFSHGKMIEDYQWAPKKHTTLILPMIAKILSEAALSLSQLDALAFGRGPGSFTGIRITASAIQAMAFAHDLPVIPISTLRALAQGCYRDFQQPSVLVTSNAGLGEVYWGEYYFDPLTQVMQVVTDDVLSPIANITSNARFWCGAGSDWGLFEEHIQNKLQEQLQHWMPNRYPCAQDIACLASADYTLHRGLAADQALPVYLREPHMSKKNSVGTAEFLG